MAYARNLTPAEQAQEVADFGRAYEELRVLNLELDAAHKRRDQLEPVLRSVDSSVDFVREQVRRAEGVIYTLSCHYTKLRMRPLVVDVSDDEDDLSDEYPVSDEEVFFAVHSSQLAVPSAAAGELVFTEQVVAENQVNTEEDPSPPYTSAPGTPSRSGDGAVHPETSQQSDYAANGPTLFSQSVPASQSLVAVPSTPRRANHTPAAPSTPPTPSTPSSSQHGDIGGTLTSPAPHRKHYIVTKGRRTGIYRTWPEAEAYTNGLPGAVYQGLRPYELAISTYFQLRARGMVQVIRGPNDTNEQYGHPDSAEDII